jgi:HSP20 family molecular chaperone IbpA
LDAPRSRTRPKRPLSPPSSGKVPERAPGRLPQGADPRRRLEREIGALFDQLFAPVHPVRALVRPSTWHPFTDVYEDETQFLVRMELAGIDPESLEIRKDGRCLVVRGTRPDPLRGRPLACHQLEISYGTFERVLCLPVDFREEAVRPEYHRSSGFLEITIGKE